MKRIAIILAVATSVAACNNDPLVKGSRTEVDSVQIVKQTLKNMRDSLKLDSFERAERAEKENNTKSQATYNTFAKPAASQTQYVRTYSSYEQPAAQTQSAKQGWSSAAKGTAIGAGVGAVTGVLVDKKDGRGAVIGGLIGAGTGYAIGRSHDRKTGRVQTD